MSGFWSGDAGYDGDVIEALRERQSDRLQIVTPSETEFAGQLQLELDLCRPHLSNILEQYWESNWRHEHKAFGTYPEDHLWRAAAAVREIETALTSVPRAEL